MTVAIKMRFQRGGEDGGLYTYLWQSNWDGVINIYGGIIPDPLAGGDFLLLDIEGNNDALAEEIGWDTDV